MQDNPRTQRQEFRLVQHLGEDRHSQAHIRVRFHVQIHEFGSDVAIRVRIVVSHGLAIQKAQPFFDTFLGGIEGDEIELAEHRRDLD